MGGDRLVWKMVIASCNVWDWTVVSGDSGELRWGDVRAERISWVAAWRMSKADAEGMVRLWGNQDKVSTVRMPLVCQIQTL